ncbi:MAG: sugar ABC transporter ATP-binding protein [Ornithinimicrobium sp.]|nr:sugar ABC transporter ATP-binding protein [Ornithinimicrobium sp.]MDO5738788.1 sugar ABC transporter ATP-binding protein [Ornithinimicrobium sp.]
MRGIVKAFPGVRALGGVDLDVRAGEVHCLLGQNGAGKSTLIKILSGAQPPDEGQILLRGEPVRFASPIAALKAGVATIYQELDLVPELSVAENVFLGHEFDTAGFTQRRETVRRTTELLTSLGHPEISAHREVGRLSAAKQQTVSMCRAMSHDSRVIIMDEPSAVLDQDEVSTLFQMIRDLTAQGVGIIYISHRLEEIRLVGDRVTVLKDGVSVASGLSAKDTPTSELIRLMTGRSISYVFPDRPGVPEGAEVALSVENLSDGARFRGATFDVHAGEVLGIAGLVGAGRSEILETIFGARRARTGSVKVHGEKVRSGSVKAAVRAGMGLCPEERKSQGLLLDQSVSDNITISSLKRFSRLGFLDDRRERRESSKLVNSLDLRPRDVNRAARTLSGGNQQKALLARWLMRDCRVLLLDEPTRGVDVGARSEIYALIRDLADRGVAIIVVSSDVEEVLGLADRVLVVREGSVVHEGAAETITEHDVLNLVMEGGAA